MNLYDLVPYESRPYRHCHPDRLWTIARLFGLLATHPAQARVLEIGCGAGGNLVPMAMQMPDALFMGIDLSERAIADARTRIARFRVPNVTVEVCDILNIPASLGRFDYILCHGVYSWIPAPVRDALLAAIRRHLTPTGVAYVSYNVYPGWRLLEVTRDLMQVHARGFDDPLEQVEQAREFVKFAAQSAKSSDSAWSKTLQEAAERMDVFGPEYFFHDFLAPHNSPVLLLDFVASAQKHQLRYLGDADVGQMLGIYVPDAARESLGKLASTQVGLEQYVDLVRGTTFRRTLLCHGEVDLNRKLSGTEVAEMYVSLRGKLAAADPESGSADSMDFKTPEGAEVAITGPLVTTALRHLHASAPRELSVIEMLDHARAQLGWSDDSSRDEDLSDLGSGLVHAFSAEVIDLAPRRRQACMEVSASPLSDGYARGLAAAGEKYTPNVRHETVGLDRFTSELLMLCDGLNDHAQIVDGLVAAAQAGRLNVQVDDVEQTEPQAIREVIKTVLPIQLDKLLRQGLLVR
ncbi:MAG: class I SAM-dependent methyltransferase [Gammaproteobacteria bacterium]|nr:class I SAM-dependent methyltransferase [Gammaproteobacteria bacterium]